MLVQGYGVRAQLPSGWEAVVRPSAPPAGRHALEPEGEVGSSSTPQSAAPRPATLHAGTFALPSQRGDFGSGAVDRMGTTDSFVALLEYGPEEVGRALFASQGLPRRLDPRQFSTSSLQRALPGQAGWQTFFTDHGRPFCLYVVLGDAGDALRQVRRVEQLLDTIEIEEAVHPLLPPSTSGQHDGQQGGEDGA